VEVVYNTINREIFKPTPGNLRQTYGLQGQKILLGVASVWDARKGLRDLIALNEMLAGSYKIVLVGLNEEQIQTLPADMLGLPRTNSMTELAQWYTAADVFVCPSYEETFGMTAMEARACGTEAVVYQNTACEEIVEKFGGIAVPMGPEYLLEAVLKLTKEEDT